MKRIDSTISSELNQVRVALDEHLTAINENTLEIQTVFDYLQEIETKLEKLSQRLDQLQLNQNIPFSKPAIAPLNQLEKNIFLTLYTEESPLSYWEISERSQISFAIVSESIASLISKGIPLHRSFSNNQLFVRMDSQFKEIQAKENLVNLSLQSFME